MFKEGDEVKVTDSYARMDPRLKDKRGVILWRPQNKKHNCWRVKFDHLEERITLAEPYLQHYAPKTETVIEFD